jgi:hypothetical protein
MGGLMLTVLCGSPEKSKPKSQEGSINRKGDETELSGSFRNALEIFIGPKFRRVFEYLCSDFDTNHQGFFMPNNKGLLLSPLEVFIDELEVEVPEQSC